MPYAHLTENERYLISHLRIASFTHLDIARSVSSSYPGHTGIYSPKYNFFQVIVLFTVVPLTFLYFPIQVNKKICVDLLKACQAREP